MPEGKKCLIYTRPCKFPQPDSLELQKERLRQFARQQGYTVVGETTDLATVQDASRSHSFDVLAVSKLNQLARNVGDVLPILDDLSASGQKVHAVQEGIVDPSNYRAIAVITSVYQQMEAAAEAPDGGESQEHTTEPEESQAFTLT